MTEKRQSPKIPEPDPADATSTEAVGPVSESRQKRPRRKYVTNRAMIKILPIAAARLEALLRDEGEVGLTLAIHALTDGFTATYCSAMANALAAVVEEQNWPSVDFMAVEWIDFSVLRRPDSPRTSGDDRLSCKAVLYEEEVLHPCVYDRMLTLNILPTGLQLKASKNDDEYVIVDVACPGQILVNLISRQ